MRWGNGELWFNGCGIPFLQDENILEMEELTVTI
jgi:hypothetical protein